MKRWSPMSRWAATLFVLAALAAPAAAQEDDDPSSSRAESFQAADGPNTENIPGGALMIGAYGTAFILVLGYVVSLGFRQSATAKDIAALKAEIDAGRDPED